MNYPSTQLMLGIIAGGRSSRWGGETSKCFSLFEKDTMMSFALKHISLPLHGICIRPDQFSDWEKKSFTYPVIQESHSDLPEGPLKGFHCLLSSLEEDHSIVIIPCDMPFVTDAVLAELWKTQQLFNTRKPLVLTYSSGKHTPICLLSKWHIESLERYLLAGEQKLIRWLDQEQAIAVPWMGDQSCLQNMNYVEDCQSAFLLRQSFQFLTKKDIDMDLLDLRVKTSRLIGQDENLVLHGGGNTSVKIDDLIYVKASGWNLDTIERQGFAPVKLQALLDLLALDRLSDTDMVRLQREAMPDQSFPNPSVEAILHALIPFTFVDHTHADAIVTISNSVKSKEILEQIYPENFLILPYVMPGFDLAKQVHQATQAVDWSRLEAIILLNHGVFTFDHDGMKSYEKMLAVVKVAEDYLAQNTNIEMVDGTRKHDVSAIMPPLRACKGHDLVMLVNTSPIAQTFASRSDLTIAQAGVLTPEHIIRTKQMPVIFDEHYAEDIEDFARNYMGYFHRHAKNEIMLNPCPNWGILKGMGTISFGKTEKEAQIIQDINNHTMTAMLRAEQLGGYVSLNEADSFAMEYWELEQAKLRAK